MRKFFAIIALMFMCVSPAFADRAEDEKKIREWIAAKDTVIKVTTEWRANACSKLTSATKASCEGMYDLVIQRRLAEKATLELWMKALQLDLEPKDRSLILLTVVPSDKLNAMSNETSKIAEFADMLYPQPKKSAAK